MKLSSTMAIAILCAIAVTAAASHPVKAPAEEEALLEADRTLFTAGNSGVTLNDNLLDPDFTWTNSFGITRNKSEIIRGFTSGKGLPIESGSAPGERVAHIDGRLGVVQESSGKLFILRVWVKRGVRWRLLVYQVVSIGAPPSAESGNGKCENPCTTVPFEPQNSDQREVIHAYQAVERAVTDHYSAAWGAHIADEFFAVTSNSDRPIGKIARMAGLDNQKTAGIAPFPLVSARMFEFGDAMVMISLQQPEHGLPLHVTRVWFKRHGAWLEAYSYQTTIHAGKSTG